MKATFTLVRFRTTSILWMIMLGWFAAQSYAVLASPTSALTIPVKGKVLDSKGAPLPGVNIVQAMI